MGCITGKGLNVAAAGFLWLVLPSGVASAQVAPNAGLETPVDAYGNARPLYRERRQIGVFQNEVQRRALRDYQDLGRRANRRGGELPFALPGDFNPRFRNPAPIDPLQGGPLSYATRKAYERYGGFGQRAGRHTQDDLATILGRRQSILMATSGTAPIQRSLWQHGIGAVAAEPRPGGADPETIDVDERSVGETLVERLNRVSKEKGQELQAEARRKLREGEYRSAAQAFESAYTVTHGDFDSRVREIFCHLALGSTRTALVLLHALIRRDANPFDQQIDATAELGRRSVTREIRVRTVMYAQVNDSADSLALHAFTLWYLGEREESVLIAHEIAEGYPDSNYAEWPERMRVASSSASDAGGPSS